MNYFLRSLFTSRDRAALLFLKGFMLKILKKINCSQNWGFLYWIFFNIISMTIFLFIKYVEIIRLFKIVLIVLVLVLYYIVRYWTLFDIIFNCIVFIICIIFFIFQTFISPIHIVYLVGRQGLSIFFTYGYLL